MSKTKINLNGIVRNIPESTVKDGACEEVINMRFKDGAWRPVVKGDVIGSISSAQYHKIFVHKGNDYTNYIGIKNDIISWFSKDEALVHQNIHLDSDIININPIGNLIKVFCENDVYVLFFYDGLYHKFGDIVFPTLSFNAEEDDISIVPDNGYVTEPNFLNGFNLQGLLYQDGEDRLKMIELVKGMYGKITEQRNKKGAFEGHVLIRYAFKMYDGSYYNLSPVYYLYVPKYYTANGSIIAQAFDIKLAENDTALKLKVNLGKVSMLVNESLQLTESFKRLFTSVDIFMTKPLSDCDFDKVRYKQTLSGDKSIEMPRLRVLKEKLLKKTSFYKIDTIPIEDIVEGYQKTFEFDENNITSNPILNEEYSYAHKDIARSTFEYNNRVIQGNIITRLFKGFGADYFSRAKRNTISFKRVRIIVVLKNRFDTEVKSYITYISGFFVFNPLLSYPDKNAVKMIIYIEDRPNGKYYERTFELEPHPFLNIAFYLNKTIVEEGQGSGVEFEYEGLPIRLTNENQYNLPSWYNMDSLVLEGETACVKREGNKVKMSELNNPFVNNVKNTYLVGKGEIKGFTVNAMALSQGQFGQYPVLVFSTDGIWAMEQGNGEVLYKSIVPINREVCNNSDSITQLDRATVFSTDKGLMLIMGTEVKEISMLIEGEPEHLQIHNTTYNMATNHSQLVSLLDRHSAIPFKQYLKEAVLGYDYQNKELIVSNSNYPYAYAYGIQSRVWHKTTNHYKLFANNYPQTIGVNNDGNMFDVSKETTGYKQVLFQTKAIKLNSESYKAMRRVILRGLIKTKADKHSGFYVFGSYDAIKWAYLGGIQNKNEFRDMVAKTLRTDCKYFKIVFAGEIAHDSYINYLELDTTGGELQGKLR